MNRKTVLQYSLIYVMAIFVAALAVNYDYDLFARLEVGEIFFKLHKILQHDPFSYTPTISWIDHEWASGVVFYAFLKLIGSAGLILLNAALSALVPIFILKNNKDIKHPLIISAIFIIFIKYSAGNLIRCQAFTYAFAALTLYILEKFRQTNTKLIWVLPVLVAFWCNMHGGVVSGLGIISMYCLISIIKREKFVKTLLTVTILSYMALFINPYGAHYPWYLYTAVTIPRKYIEDWQSIFSPRNLYPYLWIVIMFITMLGIKIYSDIKNKVFDLYQYVLLLITVPFGFAHIKGLQLASVTIFMFCSKDVDNVLNKYNPWGMFEKIEKSLYLVIIILGITIPFNITTPRLTYSIYPIAETEFLKINDIKGNIFSVFELGSYLSYKLYPNNKIFIDGRYDGVYPMEVFNDHLDFMNGMDNWRTVIKKYPTDIFILPLHFYKPIKYLKENPQLGYVDVFYGYKYCIFLKKDLVKPKYKQPPGNLKYYRDNVFKTDFVKYLKEEKND